MRATVEEWLGESTIRHAVYTPAELEKISGLSADMQRVWRRRGQLPSHGSGHARFSIPEAIDITLRYALSKIGIPPSDLKLDLSKATSAAMAFAIFSHGGCEVVGPADDVDQFLLQFSEDQGELGVYLAGSPKEFHYLVLNEWHESRVVDDPTDLVSNAEELSIVFNLELLGSRLVERGRKPVVTIRLPDRSGQRTVRWLTGVGANDS
ncbi:MAG TPA: hypothetical protein VHS33_02690 [Sphingomicrobium sp.]|jgi:hypothetical protein|nr:hypothetical protein [Sphingomicrobium sp.]